jgi:Flp pilus assembly protein TadG
MKNIKRERGQSLVELSISLVILLYLLSGAVEFGIAFFQFVQLRDAVQEGALYASMNPGPSNEPNIFARIRGASDSPIDLNTLTPVITYSGAACEGNSVTVTLTYNHQIFMPFMSEIIGPSIPLVARVTDTILSPVCP